MTTDLDPDRTLALAYVKARLRPAVEALWRLDVSLGTVLSSGRDPMISQIRLAWWRESLEKLDQGHPPAEPVLRALATHVVPYGIGGKELSQLEEGWAVLLSPEPLGSEDLQAYARARGGLLFRFSARLLGDAVSDMASAGECWALVDLARHSGESEAGAALEAASERNLPSNWPSRLRPLGMLAVLARRDLDAGQREMERPGAPARMFRMLRHRLTGR
ncbi:MAG TPA: squalene/phytoene synthase family protein [Allosphingosinicella sp.]|nr:squalene/phytoene synthase family protein [Allosphingosinicella sp.]